jgi:hypothetical protein
MSEEKLAEVGKKIGTNDLILCEEMNPTPTTLSKTLKAVTGALVQSQVSVCDRLWEKSSGIKMPL